MPSCLRTTLAPPSQPTRKAAEISEVLPARSFTVAVTPFASWLNDSNSWPKRTETLGSVSATDFRNGSSVYCEISW